MAHKGFIHPLNLCRLMSSDLGSRSLGTRMRKPLNNQWRLSWNGTIWAYANLQRIYQSTDLPTICARHTERSRTHATCSPHRRSFGSKTDKLSSDLNQEI